MYVGTFKAQWIPNIEKVQPNRKTKFPIDLLKEIATIMQVQEIDGKAIDVLESELIFKLGNNIASWVLNPKLSICTRIFDYVMPLLPKEITKLQPTFIEHCCAKFVNMNPKVLLLGPLWPGKPLKYNALTLNQYTKFAIFLNTSAEIDDSHWVGAFFDIELNTMNYFDSLGHLPPEVLQQELDQFFFVLQDVFPEFKQGECQYNQVMLQTFGFDCGVYTTLFLKYKIENSGKNITDFRKDVNLSVPAVNAQRSILWNEYSLPEVHDKEMTKELMS